MKKRNLYLPYEIENRVMTEYVAKEFQNTYFEMIFVLEGNGVQVINSNRLAYGPNKLFLVFPIYLLQFFSNFHSICKRNF